MNRSEVRSARNVSRPGYCQVARGSVGCHRRPRWLVAVALLEPGGVTQRTYRMCDRHAQRVASDIDWQLIAISPYRDPAP